MIQLMSPLGAVPAARQAVLAFLMLALMVPFANADVEIIKAEFVPNLEEYWCDLRISGTIATPDAVVLDELECARANIYLRDSLGWDADVAMHIGRWARERRATIAVGADTSCFSSCALVYIGGVDRVNLGKIGLHRPYLAGAPLSDDEIAASVSHMLDRIRGYVDEMGVGSEFVSAMINTSPSDMRLLERDEIYELVAKTDAVHDEMRVARNARNYGLTTDEYRRRKFEAEENCTATKLGLSRYIKVDGPEMTEYFAASYECEQAILWGLSRSVYKTRYEDAAERCNFGDPTDDEFRDCGIRVMRGLE